MKQKKVLRTFEKHLKIAICLLKQHLHACYRPWVSIPEWEVLLDLIPLSAVLGSFASVEQVLCMMHFWSWTSWEKLKTIQAVIFHPICKIRWHFYSGGEKRNISEALDFVVLSELVYIIAKVPCLYF